jgi:hypothetical protein
LGMPCPHATRRTELDQECTFHDLTPFSFFFFPVCFIDNCRRSCLSFASDVSLPKAKERMAVAATLMGGQSNAVQATGATIMPTGLFAHVARLMFEPKESNIEFRISDQVPNFLSHFPPANLTLFGRPFAARSQQVLPHNLWTLTRDSW